LKSYTVAADLEIGNKNCAAADFQKLCHCRFINRHQNCGVANLEIGS
jgi:hypothetical protein